MCSRWSFRNRKRYVRDLDGPCLKHRSCIRRSSAAAGRAHDRMSTQFPPDFYAHTFTARNGERAWRPSLIPAVVRFLIREGYAILGGEYWCVSPGTDRWTGLIPTIDGSTTVFSWETKRNDSEMWDDYIARCAQDTILTVQEWALPGGIVPSVVDNIFCNLTWVSEVEYDRLLNRAP